MEIGLLDDLLNGLLDDAALLDADDEARTETVERHLRYRANHPNRLYSLLITDRAAAEVNRIAGRIEESSRLPVTMINTTGAGGLTSLAGRDLDHLQLVAVDSPLRDPGDLIGNLARVAAAARQLNPEIIVRVQIPYGIGWQDAIAEAEAEGLQGHVDCGDSDRLIERLREHVEADLSFAADLPRSGVTATNLVCALDALIDGAELPDASALLTDTDQDRLVSTIGAFTPNRIGRVRRRLTALRCPNVDSVLDGLRA